MRIRAVLLAVLALASWPAQVAQAQTQDEIWRAVNQVSYGDLHRRPPTAPLPPLDPDAAAKWRAELAAATRATPTATVWDAVKAGGTNIIRNPVNLLKGGARMVGQGALFQIGALGINAALSAFYNSASSSVKANSELYLCLSNSLANNYSIGTGSVCEIKVTSSSLSFPYGTLPPVGSTARSTWWRYQNGDYEFYVYGNGCNNTSCTFKYTVVYKCVSNGISSAYNDKDVSFINYVYNDYVARCKPPPVSSSDPISLTDFVEGVPSKNVPPHPAMKEEIKNVVVQYIENTYPQPAAGGQIYPGMTLSPPPSRSGWYGVPISIYDDEDADGWSDWEEVLRESDPNDPNSKPNPARDTDGDGVSDADEDRLGTDPYDPASTPDRELVTDTDGDGTVDADDPDDDNDGWTDAEEIAAGSNPKVATSKPVDTDGDRIPDGVDPDDDNDSFTDSEELAAGTDPLNPESKPPPKDPPACPTGQKSDGGTPPKCIPDTDPKDPVGDQCGDLSVKRLLAHTGHYLRDVIFPCRETADMLKPVMDALKTRFPFSLGAALNGWFDSAPTTGGDPGQLPESIGIIPTDWGWLAPLWVVIKNVVGVGLWAWFVYWLIDRFTPQAVM